MKILFFTRRFWPEIGGVEKHCLEVGKRLAKMGHEVTVVSESSTSEESRSLPRLHPRCLKAYYIPVRTSKKSKKFRIWGWLWKNRNLIKEADVVHCHDVFYWYLPFRFFYPRKKVFTTFHGWEGIFPPRQKDKLVRKISEKLSFGNVCVGDYIEKWYGTRANGITYGGVANPPKGFLGLARNDKQYNICFVGRLEEDTGLMIYLKALQELKMYNVQFTIKFLGDGGLRGEAEKYGKVLGFVEDVEKYIRKADFVFTSGYLSILEAMINKKLVFSVYDNELKKDYLKTAPFAEWIVIEKDALALAKKIGYFANRPGKSKKLIDGGYDWARQQTWDKLTNQYLSLWLEGKFL